MAKDKRSLYQKGKDLASSVPVKFGSSIYGGIEIMDALKHMGLFKDGGRVRGCSIAKRGFGKVMRKKK